MEAAAAIMASEHEGNERSIFWGIVMGTERMPEGITLVEFYTLAAQYPRVIARCIKEYESLKEKRLEQIFEFGDANVAAYAPYTDTTKAMLRFEELKREHLKDNRLGLAMVAVRNLKIYHPVAIAARKAYKEKLERMEKAPRREIARDAAYEWYEIMAEHTYYVRGLGTEAKYRGDEATKVLMEEYTIGAERHLGDAIKAYNSLFHKGKGKGLTG